MKIFVTGGAGFIGSNFVREHLKAHPNDQVVVYDSLTYAASLDRLPQGDSRLTFIKGDICDFSTCVSAMNGCDMIVHFAA